MREIMGGAESLYLNAVTRTALWALAEATGASRSALLKQATEEFVEKHKNKIQVKGSNNAV